MIRSILVPLDGSPVSERAIPLALSIARHHAARVALVSVHLPFPPSETKGAPPIDPRFDIEQGERTLRRLGLLRSRAHRAGLRDVECFLLEGRDVLDELEGFIASHQIDLVVMTTHGRSGLSRLWLGSVSEGLLRRIRIPILLTRARHPMPEGDTVQFPFSRVLVALDGSEASEGAIEDAYRLAGSTPIRVILAHVVSMALMPLSALGEVAVDQSAHINYLEPLAERLRQGGRTVSVATAVHGHVARGLLEIAAREGADLIALSSHGQRGYRRLLLGSTADKVIRSSRLPLLVHVPPR